MLLGPTGVGKTEVLLNLFSGYAEVVSADALQIYKGQDIGTAKPEPKMLSRLPHHLIDIIDYEEEFNVGEFLHRARLCIQDIHSRGKLPVLSGGNGFYLKSWLMGLPKTPRSDSVLRSRLEKYWADRDVSELRKELMKVDPVSASRIGRGDRYRMLRALELYEQTGQPRSSFSVPNTLREDVRLLIIGLTRSREDLSVRIEKRVDGMLSSGLEQEVKSLCDKGAREHHPGMKGIGYREWFVSPDRVRELIIRNTRRYAKRQMTFFRAIPGIQWFNLTECSDWEKGIKKEIDRFLK